MAERVAAVFHTREAAERAADALVGLGADRGHVSMLARGEEGMMTSTTPAGYDRDDTDFVEPAREVGDAGAPMTTADDDDAAAGAATGMAIGAVAGLAAGAMALMVPGFGLVLAAGPLAWALGGVAGATAAGAIAGGVYGGLRDIGIEERHATGYEERIRSGDVLLTALIPSIAEGRVLDVLAEYGAEDVSFADDTAISQMDVGRQAATAPMAGHDATFTRERDTLDAEREIASAPPPAARMDIPPPVPSAATTMGDTTTVSGATPMGAAGIGTGAPAADRTTYNDEAAPADVARTRSDDNLPFEVTASRSEYSTTPAERREYAQSVPSAETTRNYQSMQQDAETASYAESPIGAASTTGAAFDSNIAQGQVKQVEGEMRDRAADFTANPMDDLAAKGKKLEGTVQQAWGEATAANTNIARGEAKQIEGELRDRAADRTANPLDDLAAKAKKVEGKVQEEIGEVEETIEPRRL